MWKWRKCWHDYKWSWTKINDAFAISQFSFNCEYNGRLLMNTILLNSTITHKTSSCVTSMNYTLTHLKWRRVRENERRRKKNREFLTYWRYWFSLWMRLNTVISRIESHRIFFGIRVRVECAVAAGIGKRAKSWILMRVKVVM